MANDTQGERARQIGATVGLSLAIGAITYFVVHRDADARVLEVETRAATRLAECEEGSATRRIEIEGQLAACELDRLHARPPVVGDHVDEARATAVSGRSDVHVDQVCRYELDWNADPIEGCRAFVRCGDVPLYGGLGAGFFECTVDDEGIVRGEDAEPTGEGGDPRLVVDRAAHTITVSDDGPSWSITLTMGD